MAINWRIFDRKEIENSNQDVFKISIDKNQSFDKKKYPFKFNFAALEPEESKASAFEISPKQCLLDGKSEQTFKVTFSPSHGLGNF